MLDALRSAAEWPVNALLVAWLWLLWIGATGRWQGCVDAARTQFLFVCDPHVSVWGWRVRDAQTPAVLWYVHLGPISIGWARHEWLVRHRCYGDTCINWVPATGASWDKRCRRKEPVVRTPASRSR